MKLKADRIRIKNAAIRLAIEQIDAEIFKHNLDSGAADSYFCDDQDISDLEKCKKELKKALRM